MESKRIADLNTQLTRLREELEVEKVRTDSLTQALADSKKRVDLLIHGEPDQREDREAPDTGKEPGAISGDLSLAEVKELLWGSCREIVRLKQTLNVWTSAIDHTREQLEAANRQVDHFRQSAEHFTEKTRKADRLIAAMREYFSVARRNTLRSIRGPITDHEKQKEILFTRLSRLDEEYGPAVVMEERNEQGTSRHPGPSGLGV